MPQDNLRSVMYRSFVTCDNPKGVIEGKTIKKSKIDPQNMENHKVGKQKNSKDITKDLLKGALDLQESIVMLGKLQEASEYMTKLRKMRNGIGIGRTKSERVVDHWYDKVEFEKPRFSVDCSRDCYDELREAIRDGLARQNLLQSCCGSEKARIDRRKVELSPDFPSTSFTTSSESSIEKPGVVDGKKVVLSPDFSSTSSSQCSMVQSHEISSFECSPPKIQKEKPKAPNLIARLMGLEDIPTTQKQLEKDKVLKQRRPVFEIDLPKATKPSVIGQRTDPKQRTLDGIIETMQFKGLLRSKCIEGSNNVISHQTSVSHFLKSFADDAPPIVIMKPMYAPEMQAQKFPSDTKETFGKWNSKEENSAVNFTIYRKLQARKVETSSGQKSNEVVIQGKLPSTKSRDSSPVKTKQPKKEAIEERIGRTQQAVGAKKSGEMKNADLNTTAKFQDQSKRTTAKVRKPERKSNAPEKLVALPNSTISKRVTAIASNNSRNRKKNVKTEKSVKSSSVVPMVEIMEHKDGNIQIVQAVDRDSNITITKITSSEELPCEEVTEIFENVVIDNLNTDESFASESTVPFIQCDHDIPLMEHTSYQVHLHSTEKEDLKSRATTRHILLSNESFLSRAEELFDTDAWEPTVWKTISVDNEVAENTLLLDCANELLEHKRSQCTLVVSKNPIKTSKISISFDKLVNEICDKIEVLKSYTKVAGNNLSIGTLYALHERDIWCNEVVSTTWDLGWRNGFTLDEVEQVVTDIEKHLLSGIIDDVLTEFVL
ncbi:uncharacterized protein LOC107794997 [Nicotiana tabacum]|uniref:DUF3741 domain-containing protein n=3 Tax=Nicotiana TaxID=4085 RepID=A0A1S4A8S6_TOBAC|nr:PREDICTED: uncharacterized protein LOC104210603 [Nicotiana sylvestris]XP_009757846.1 PREDICTED: uncharacterized protein LOC104210603 [Nicotiana sylvestris]XP_009757847.1 PREDICTED: uncharacterized protein LOC104210603 [Nicotiana sylvestris]XP_009757848.1 PREDICTED: uncharacterized protein LOC104210603 [Nicotiana sylvestris]XP_016473041.1 PREDICTED: uncharacterized protein LOC107794997 [Nicotiana tabacum]XP_016473042.1 PREDICTED: uncharacterized protein LOC107794997 [Nicotiana tabacum]XP_01